MLSNRGSARLSFIITFLLLFLVCGIYCIFMIGGKILPSFSQFKTSKSEKNSYESEMTKATRNYVNDYYQDLDSGEELIIKLSTLREYKYVTLNDCQGYSVVTKENGINIDSYVKCSNYKSANYDDTELE